MPSPFDPIRIASLQLPNRIVMAPIKTAMGSTDGQVTDQHVAFFRRRVAGGVGLIISEPLYVDKRGQEHPKQLGIDADDKLPALQGLARAIHEAGGRVFAHLNHGGRAANPKAAGGPPEAPSNVPCPRTGFEPEVLTAERIAGIVAAFAAAAGRARKAGFDGVELQFGLGYLVSQFLSRATNLRTDAYGGDLPRRERFAREVFAAVRAAVGDDDFPIGVRISGSEKAPKGLEINDAKQLARSVEQWGAHLVHVATGSNCESLPWYFQHMSLPPGVNEALAAQVRQAVGVPVMVAGRLGDPARIREVLAEGMVDLVALGRPLLADPDLPAKMRADRDAEVLLCGHCLQGCFGRVKSGLGIGCNINPELGHELQQVAAADHARRVLVVGGGPAGIQAALTAQRRGHEVTLFERSQLGGQFALACRAPGKARMEQALRSMVAQLERSAVKLRVGESATAETLAALTPDAVILATGSVPVASEIPGIEDPVSPADVLTGSREVGHDVLVLGGGMVGMEVAETLARAGKRCVVVELLEDVNQDMDPISRKMMSKRIAALPLEVHTRTELVRIDEEGGAIVSHDGQQRELGRFDSIVVAVGNRSFDPLSEQLRASGIAVQIVGDSERPGQIFDAVTAGHAAAMSL